MKIFIQLAISVLFLIMVNQAGAAPDNVELSNPHPDLKRGAPVQNPVEKYLAIESMSLRINIDKRLHGFVEGKVCDACKKIRVTITPQTKAYDNNIEVPLKRAEDRLGRYATVIYEVKTKKVISIRW